MYSGAIQRAFEILPALTEEQKADFQQEGFLRLPSICTPDEVARLLQILERLFAERAGFEEGAQYDLVAGRQSADAPAKLPQLLYPVNYAPELRDTAFRENALRLARQLLGADARPAFEHAVLKPAHHGAETPWHQDEAHRFDPAYDYEQLSIWMPLQEATPENGCMRYIPGTNRGELLPHRSPHNDPTVYALETDPNAFDVRQAVACPLPAGGCTIHHGRTIHSAGPNQTNRPRYAYILAFERPPRARATPRRFAWNEEKQTDAQARRRAWRRRGGVLVEIARRVRHRLRTNPLGLYYDVRWALRAAWRKLGL